MLRLPPAHCTVTLSAQLTELSRYSSSIDQVLTVLTGYFTGICRYFIPPEEPTKAKQAVVVFTFYSDFIQILTLLR